MHFPHHIIETAFRSLYPEKEWKYTGKIRYSGRFKGFNASISRRGTELTLSLSREWRTVDNDIVTGLAQELIGKIFKDRKKTFNIELYQAFIKKVGQYMPKTEPPLELKESFQRVNNEYFYGLMDIPNIEWCEGINRVGYYEYGTDTISLSRELARDIELLDYVMYHELLHKKHKFTAGPNTKTTRTRHHTTAFREDEHKYHNWKEAERRLQRLGRRKKWGLF